MRYHTMLVTALLLLPFSVPAQAQQGVPAPYGPPPPPRPAVVRPADGRTLWAYGDADQFQFRRRRDGRWVEYAADGKFSFDEVARTPDYVELYDPTRQIGARLYDDGLWTRAPGNRRFDFSLPGHWAQ